MRRLVYFVGTSVDGCIAGPSGETEFFPTSPQLLGAIFERYPETCPAHVRGVFGMQEEPRHFDTVIMGARTHEPAVEAGMTHAYPHLEQLVVTHRTFPAADGLTFVRDRPVSAVRALKRQPGRDIWLGGGADLASQLWDEIDELHLKVYPVVVGTGVPLFHGDRSPSSWVLTATETLPEGVLLNRYSRTG